MLHAADLATGLTSIAPPSIDVMALTRARLLPRFSNTQHRRMRDTHPPDILTSSPLRLFGLLKTPLQRLRELRRNPYVPIFPFLASY